MRRLLAFSVPVTLAVILGLAAGCAPEADAPPPDFRLLSLEGKLVGPAEFPGEAVVVDFWASWCAPCKVQSRILRSLHAEWSGEPVRFLAVNIGEDEGTVRSYVERHPSPFPVLLDPEDTLSSELGITSLPTLMVIDSGGEVVYFEPGVISSDRLESLLERAT